MNTKYLQLSALQETLRVEYSIHVNAVPMIDHEWEEREEILYYVRIIKLDEGLDFDTGTYLHNPEEALIEGLIEGLALVERQDLTEKLNAIIKL